MAYKEKEIEKLYYSIGEVAAMLDVNASLLRYWEKEFDILSPKKNTKGDRFFTKDDIEKIKLIYHLVREKGYTLDGAKIQLKSKFEEEQKKLRLIEKLKSIRSFMVDLRDELEKKP
jgi:DNA-binding transcriptional MerR regulator